MLLGFTELLLLITGAKVVVVFRNCVVGRAVVDAWALLALVPLDGETRTVVPF